MPESEPISSRVPDSEPPPNNFWGWVFLGCFVVGIPLLGIVLNLFKVKPHP